MSKAIEAQHQLDATGLKCPLPVLRAQKYLRGVAAGEIVLLRASDDNAWEEVPLFCEQAGYVLLQRERVSAGEVCGGFGGGSGGGGSGAETPVIARKGSDGAVVAKSVRVEGGDAGEAAVLLSAPDIHEAALLQYPDAGRVEYWFWIRKPEAA